MKMQIGWKYHICGAFNNLEYVSPAVCEPSSSFTHDLIWLIKHPAKQQQLKIDFLSNTITLKTNSHEINTEGLCDWLTDRLSTVDNMEPKSKCSMLSILVETNTTNTDSQFHSWDVV